MVTGDRSNTIRKRSFMYDHVAFFLCLPFMYDHHGLLNSRLHRYARTSVKPQADSTNQFLRSGTSTQMRSYWRTMEIKSDGRILKTQQTLQSMAKITQTPTRLPEITTLMLMKRQITMQMTTQRTQMPTQWIQRKMQKNQMQMK